jgi:hypothetical protein
VTHENCHRQLKYEGEVYACAACVKELDAIGYYEKQEAEAAQITPMSEVEYSQERYNLYHSWQPPPTDEEIQGKALFQHIKDETRKGKATSV